MGAALALAVLLALVVAGLAVSALTGGADADIRKWREWFKSWTQ